VPHSLISYPQPDIQTISKLGSIAFITAPTTITPNQISIGVMSHTPY